MQFLAFSRRIVHSRRHADPPAKEPDPRAPDVGGAHRGQGARGRARGLRGHDPEGSPRARPRRSAAAGARRRAADGARRGRSRRALGDRVGVEARRRACGGGPRRARSGDRRRRRHDRAATGRAPSARSAADRRHPQSVGGRRARRAPRRPGRDDRRAALPSLDGRRRCRGDRGDVARARGLLLHGRDRGRSGGGAQHGRSGGGARQAGAEPTLGRDDRARLGREAERRVELHRHGARGGERRRARCRRAGSRSSRRCGEPVSTCTESDRDHRVQPLDTRRRRRRALVRVLRDAARLPPRGALGSRRLPERGRSVAVPLARRDAPGRRLHPCRVRRAGGHLRRRRHASRRRRRHALEGERERGRVVLLPRSGRAQARAARRRSRLAARRRGS